MFVTVTVAPGMTAPLVSVTVPRMEPVVDWEGKIPSKTETIRQQVRTLMTAFRITLSFACESLGRCDEASEINED
jgi:hypothetical protein